MNVVSNNGIDIESTKDKLKVKYSFLYSILISERWHELSLVKRVNTVLLIEAQLIEYRWLGKPANFKGNSGLAGNMC